MGTSAPCGLIESADVTKYLSETRRSVLAILFAGAALVAWALASPIGSTPDENFHLASVWCAKGDRQGFCEQSDASDERRVPVDFLGAVCFAFHPETSGDCQPEFADDPELASSDRVNSGLYPPVFYWTMNWFAGRDIVRSVVTMRIVNVLVFCGMLTAVAVVVPRGIRRAVVAGAALTVVPLGMFFIPSINPSSWALTSAVTFTPALLGYLVTEGRRRWVLGGLAALSLLLGAGARADAAVYTGLGVAAAVALGWRAGRRNVKDLALPAALGVASVLMYSATGQSDPSGWQEGSSAPGVVSVLTEVPRLWAGALGGPGTFGGWGLGWLDTSMPAAVWVLSWSVLAGVLFSAVPGRDRRHLLVLVAAGGALWLVPAYMQLVSGYPVGAYVQPRYVLPLLAMFVMLALVRLRGEVRWSRAQWVLVVLALSLANSLALHTTLRRFVTGLDGPANLDSATEWWWSVPVSPMVVWAAGSVAFFVSTALALMTMLDGPAGPTEQGTDPPTPADDDAERSDQGQEGSLASDLT